MGLREIDSLLTMLILLSMTSVIGKHLCILVCLLFGEVWLGVRLAWILWFELSVIMFIELVLSNASFTNYILVASGCCF